jgi:two-component system nitrogen regulation sensor histidine kinase NtrY
MIKNIIETYNGTISFSSIIGEGSEFIIRFPKHSQNEL